MKTSQINNIPKKLIKEFSGMFGTNMLKILTAALITAPLKKVSKYRR